MLTALPAVVLAMAVAAGPARAQNAPSSSLWDSLADSNGTGTASPDPAVGPNLAIPDLTRVLPPTDDPQSVTATLQVLVLLTVLTLVPSILVMMTAFPRIVVVLALLRQAVGTPQLPPGPVLMGLSLFITMLVMSPTWHKIQRDAVTPYFGNTMGQRQAIDITLNHLRDFMYLQIEQADNHEDIYMFLEYAEDRAIPADEVVAVDKVPMTVMIPAFMLSELKTAFIMGFRIYLPFLVIDMVIATILLSMGMMMLPPVLISLPFKILLFVLADGWHLVVRTLLYSFA
ncbi:MAG: flagellar type III secretion system pore protein FliP [Planctomycetota bacterium]|jgi:flagellar biosynthetic protein FliP